MCKILHISYKDSVTNEEVRAKIQQAIGPHEDLTIVKRHKLQWYGHVSRSSGMAKSILQGTVKGGRREGRQIKRWEDNIREWTGLEFGKSQRAVENRRKMEETGCEIICNAQTTLVVKELRRRRRMKVEGRVKSRRSLNRAGRSVTTAQMTSQPFSSILLCSSLLSGTWGTPGLMTTAQTTSLPFSTILLRSSLLSGTWETPGLTIP